MKDTRVPREGAAVGLVRKNSRERRIYHDPNPQTPALKRKSRGLGVGVGGLLSETWGRVRESSPVTKKPDDQLLRVRVSRRRGREEGRERVGGGQRRGFPEGTLSVRKVPSLEAEFGRIDSGGLP